MIKIFRDWGISGCSSGNFKVGKIKIRHNKKLNALEEYIDCKKYPNSIEKALEYILDKEDSDLIINKNMTLTQAIKEQKKLRKEFYKNIETVLNKVL